MALCYGEHSPYFFSIASFLQTYFSLYEHVILSSLQHHENATAVQGKVTQPKIKRVYDSGGQKGQINLHPFYRCGQAAKGWCKNQTKPLLKWNFVLWVRLMR